MTKLAYVDNLSHSRDEFGPVNSKDLSYLLERIPKRPSVPTSVRLSLTKNKDFRDIQGKLVYDQRTDSLTFDKIDFSREALRNLSEKPKEIIINDIRLDYPDFLGSVEDYFKGNRVLTIFSERLRDYKSEGYELYVPDFRIMTHMVQVVNRGPQLMPTGSYCGHLVLTTEELIKGKGQSKLVFMHSNEGEKTPEFEEYRALIKDLDLGLSRVQGSCAI
jgi:hypothetical protein